MRERWRSQPAGGTRLANFGRMLAKMLVARASRHTVARLALAVAILRQRVERGHEALHLAVDLLNQIRRTAALHVLGKAHVEALDIAPIDALRRRPLPLGHAF